MITASRAIAAVALLVPAALMAQATPATETQAAPAQTEESADEAPKKKEKRVCRRIQKTGSRMDVRVCKTESEWNAIDEGSMGGELSTRTRANN